MNAAEQHAPVMLLSTNLARGGAENQVVQLATALHGKGWPVCVVSLMDPSAHAEELRASGVEVYSLGMHPGRPGPLGLARLLYILGVKRPAILHSHMFHANLLTRMVALVYAAPVVISTIHSLAESSRQSGNMKVRDLLYRVTDRLSDYTTCVSEAIAKRYLEIGAVSGNKLSVIPNGVDIEPFRGNTDARTRLRKELVLGNEFVWLAAGRLMWKKDYTTMLEAMARQQHGTLLIAGEGPLEANLRARAESLQLKVRFLGLRNDVPALMLACDGFVLSSVVEGLPMVLLEAAHAALPCVTTDVAGAREAVSDGETGYVVPVQNPEALVDAMTQVASMSVEERKRMGQAAQSRAAARFEISAVATQWESLYRRGLETARSNRVL